MARKKSLTLYNTDRYFNLQLKKLNEVKDFIKVTQDNAEEIEEVMDGYKTMSRRLPVRDNNHYLLYNNLNISDELIHKICTHGGEVTYYTDDIVPYYIIQLLGTHPKSQAIFQLQKEFTPKHIRNINITTMSARVVIDCPVIMPDINPYDVVFALHDLKAQVDTVEVSFPSLHEEEISDRHKDFYEKCEDGLYHVLPQKRYSFFTYIQDSLSIWKMNIHLIVERDEYEEKLSQIISKALDRRNPNRKAKRKQKGGGVSNEE